MEKKEKNTRAPGEKFFKIAGAIWISIYGELMGVDKDGCIKDPGLWTDGSEKKHLKLLLVSLRERAEKKGIVWTEEEMEKRFRAFVLAAWEDDFCSKNFMLRILNVTKTKIFNGQITPKKQTNGQATFKTTGKTIEFDRP